MEEDYTACHLTADITLALEGYMDVNNIPFTNDGVFEGLGYNLDYKGLNVTVNNKKFKIKVIPA